jgi:hypothetical protein
MVIAESWVKRDWSEEGSFKIICGGRSFLALLRVETRVPGMGVFDDCGCKWQWCLL